MMTHLQLSRAELLLLLGLLDLPTPLALGEYPADQDVAGLGVALAAATASLAARELLALPADPNAAPTPLPEVAALIADAALAEGCVIVTSSSAGNPTVRHVTRRAAAYVAHSCPLPGVHRLARLSDRRAAADQVLDGLTLARAPWVAGEAGAAGFALRAEPLAAAFDILHSGDPAAAKARLIAAGAPPAAVQAICRPGTARHALVALRGLATAEPEAAGALLLAGPGGTWLGAAEGDDPELLTLTPVGPAAVRERVEALAAWMG
jgi:hypothetical protein